MPDLIGYARISTVDQDLGEQRRRLTQAGAIRVFEDVISGQKLDRPGFSEMINFARSGDTICIVRLDRLGRSLKELLETVDLFQAKGIELRSLEEYLDTGSAAGELIFHVFGAIAQFERRLISERTRDGLRAARDRGKIPGRPPLDQEKLASAIALVKGGLSPTRAAKQLGIGRSTLYRELALTGSNPKPNP